MIGDLNLQRRAVELSCKEYPGPEYDFIFNKFVAYHELLMEKYNSEAEIDLEIKKLTAEADNYEPRLRWQHALSINILKIKLKDLQDQRLAVEKKAQDAADARAREIAEAIARVAAEEATKAATKILAEQALMREREEEARLKAEADARIKAIEEETEKLLKEKDKIIDQYKNAIEEYKNALVETQKAIDLEHLSLEYMRLAQQNQYLLDLIKTLKNPLDPILLRATIVGDIENAKAAIKLGANVNVQDMQLDTPLHKACSSNDTQMVKFLLANGCDLSKKNIAGKLASDLTSNTEIAKLISDYQKPKLTNVSTLFAKPCETHLKKEPRKTSEYPLRKIS